MIRYGGEVGANLFLASDVAARVVDTSATCPFEDAQAVMGKWKEAGDTTVFLAGTFDILTMNHVLALAQSRLLGALHRAPEGGFDKLREIAASSLVRLMVTVDTDLGLELSKSRREDKGNVPKPTLSWGTRVAMLAMQSIPSPQEGQRWQAVDYITTHGPGCCSSCPDCVNGNNADMAARLDPDVVVVSAESEKTIAELAAHRRDGALQNTSIYIVGADVEGFSDPILGGLISTTSMIARIKS